MRQRGGFSLLEVIISVTLLSFMVVGIYTMTDNAQRSSDNILTEDRHLLQTQMALSRMEADFSQTHSPLYFSALDSRVQREFSQQFPAASVTAELVPTISQPEKSEFIFMSSANRRKIQDSKQARWAWVRYSLEASEMAQGDVYTLVRQVSPENPFGQMEWSEVRRQVLLRRVKSLAFEFWDSERKRWIDRFANLPKRDRQALRALRIKLESVDTAGVAHQNIRVFRPLWPYFDTQKDERKRLGFTPRRLEL